ncbi:MAG: exodeoxyribonuclease VII small subunit [Phormidesmis priestleyi]|uniref:Exodeoxyribonuclease 7 small subunit n=1 Tax=Phormidesmis priestleyi TaxID=268141 RepID=A0A2W4XWH7_9CYAN|nr:MAG: exodeoxyribonuclease VII small subunit [Phormidesmis priestleyi]
MPRAKKTPALPADWSYEATLSRIETITDQLETGELPLETVFEQFAEAVSALQQCDQFLQSKQQSAALLIETLVGEAED